MHAHNTKGKEPPRLHANVVCGIAAPEKPIPWLMLVNIKRGLVQEAFAAKRQNGSSEVRATLVHIEFVSFSECIRIQVPLLHRLLYF